MRAFRPYRRRPRTVALPDAAPKPKRKLVQREQTLQQQIALILRLALAPDVWWSSIPAGGGGALRGKFLKSTGLRPGMPDMLICAPDKMPLWLELKAGKAGRLSEAQKACHLHLRAIGHTVEVVRSIEDAMAALDRHGIPHRVVRNRAVFPELTQPEEATDPADDDDKSEAESCPYYPGCRPGPTCGRCWEHARQPVEAAA